MTASRKNRGLSFLLLLFLVLYGIEFAKIQLVSLTAVSATEMAANLSCIGVWGEVVVSYHVPVLQVK